MTDSLTLTLTREQALDWLHRGELLGFEVRGRLLTAAEAEEELEVRKGTVKSWAHREFIQPATTGRPVMYWSHDLYECVGTYENGEVTRDKRGKFEKRMPRIA